MARKTSLTVLLVLLAAGMAVAQMSGTYTVKKDGTGDFTSVYAAGQALSSQKTNGNVVIEIYEGVYNDGYVYLYQVNQSRPQDTIYFRPAPGANVTVGNGSSSYTFYIYYTNNVKIENLNIVSSSSYVFYMYYADGCRIEGNTIRGGSSYGIYLYYYCDYDSIIRNDIKGPSSYAMYIYNGSYAYGHYIANNFITGWSSYGIYSYYGYYWKILYNTIVGTGSYAIMQYYQYGDTLKDNILQAASYCLYRYYGDALPAYSNYNCFWTGTAGASIIYTSTYGARTLAQWQALGRDVNGINLNPMTGGAMNPHLKTGSPCISAGNPISYVTNDIDGDTRDASTPDIGADEYTTVGAAMSGTYYIKPGVLRADTFPSFAKANSDLAIRGQTGSVTFEVFAGTYNEQVDLTGLTQTAFWVSYIAHLTSGVPDEVTLNSGSTYGVVLRGNKRIRFRDINVTGYASYGFYLYYSRTSAGGGCDTIVIQGCEITGGSYPIYAYNYYGGSDDSIYGNTITSSSSYGIYLYGGSSYRNYRNYIANNFITGWTSYGIYAYYQYNPKLIYNTIVGQGSYAIYAYYNYGDTLKNNIFQANSYAMYRYYGDPLPAYSNYNCFWTGSAGANIIYSSTYGAMTLTGWRGYGRDANGINLDPMTAAPANPHLKTGSPCISAANPWPGVTIDADGDARDASTPDIGADEYTTVGAPMAGVYTIKQDGTGDYRNFRSAFADIALRGYGGDVQFDVYRGTYLGTVSFSGIGNGANRLTVRAYPGEDVVINSGSTYGVYLYNNQRIRLEGLKIRGHTTYGIYASSYYSNSNTTDSCAVIGCTIDGGTYPIMWYYGDGDTIANNTINATSSYGIYWYGYSGTPRSKNNVFFMNTIQGWTSYGMYFMYQDSAKLVHNVIRGPGSYALYCYYNQGHTIRNNIFMAASYAMYHYYGDASPMSANGNDYRLNGGGASVIYSSTYGACTIQQWKTNTGKDSMSIDADPRWVSATDLHLQPTSPCIDIGALYPGCTLDMDGERRGAKADAGIDEYVLDVASRSIVAPVGGYEIGDIVTPTVALKHLLGSATTFYSYMRIVKGDTLFYYDSVRVTLAPAESLDAAFPPCTLDVGGMVWGSTTWHKAPGDNDPTNDTLRGAFTVGTIDLGVTQITSPVGTVDSASSIRPTAKVKNFGTLKQTAFKVYFAIDNGPVLWTDSGFVSFLNPGAEVEVSALHDWPKPHAEGSYRTSAWVKVQYDTIWANDTARAGFMVGAGEPGWVSKTAMPLGTKLYGDGGWLTYNSGDYMIYAARGNKSSELFAYDVRSQAWSPRAPWPLGLDAKGPFKGATATDNDNGQIYATKGNNTQGFWLYDAPSNTWIQKANIPLGPTNKKVKGGTSMAWVDNTVYLLKGYKNEFWRYLPDRDSWRQMPDAPTGANMKWDKGSWITYDPSSNMIYAHKAKYHEFYKYDPVSATWSRALTPMPTMNSQGRNKKSKDGGCAALLGSDIYALKGGNTNELWQYDIATDAWAEKETIPQMPAGGTRNKKVKGGGSMTAVSMGLYAMKGNKSNEFWRYGPSSFLYEPRPNRDGVAAEQTRSFTEGVSINPNPLANGFAVLRYGLPRAGAATVNVIDVTGRSVLSRTLAVARMGSATLDLRSLSNGVYLVKFVSDDFTASQKLVVKR
jgi:parallel beta-helix repeat protein